MNEPCTTALRIPRIHPLVGVLAVLSFNSCDHGPDDRSPVITWEGEGVRSEKRHSLDKDLFQFDLVQRTCALYVAVRSSALGSEVAFGRDMDDTMVHWNLCPSGTMVACASVPVAGGDTVEVGILWSHHGGPGL